MFRYKNNYVNSAEIERNKTQAKCFTYISTYISTYYPNRKPKYLPLKYILTGLVKMKHYLFNIFMNLVTNLHKIKKDLITKQSHILVLTNISQLCFSWQPSSSSNLSTYVVAFGASRVVSAANTTLFSDWSTVTVLSTFGMNATRTPPDSRCETIKYN